MGTYALDYKADTKKLSIFACEKIAGGGREEKVNKKDKSLFS